MNYPHTIYATNESLTRRAIVAYLRNPGSRIGNVADTLSGVVWHDARAYVVLRNRHGVTLAVYRVLWEQKLKRLRRWAAAIEDTQTGQNSA